jgi:hypothetical protein
MNKNSIIIALLLVISLIFNYFQFRGKKDNSKSYSAKEYQILRDSLGRVQAKSDSLANIEIISSIDIIEKVRDSLLQLYPDKEFLTTQIRDSLIGVMLNNKQVVQKEDSVLISADDLYIALRDGVICREQLLDVLAKYDELSGVLQETRNIQKEERNVYEQIIINKQNEIDGINAPKVVFGGGLKIAPTTSQFGMNINLGLRFNNTNDFLIHVGSLGETPYIGISYNRGIYK